jgi:RNA polymerase sigma-70 factor (ECF subfamily)
MTGRAPNVAVSTDKIWAAFAGPLRRFIRTRVANDAEAEDLLQEVFTKIHLKLAQLRDTERLAAWIYQIARNAVIDHLRARAKAPAAVEVAEDLPAPAEAPALDAEVASCLRPLIERLPDPYREALVMTELDGKTQRELAHAAGLSLSGAKSRVQRGREQLKALLLACCHVEFDRRGGVIAYEPRPGACRFCDPSTP